MHRTNARWIASTFALLLVSSTARAMGPNRPTPCPDHEPEGAGPAAAAHAAAPVACPVEKAAAHLSADERRVVGWLVEEIHRLEGSKDSSVDFTAEDVQRETGVDVHTIDADEVREAVREALSSESPPPANRDAASTPADPSPPSSASPPAGGDPESSGGPGQG
jgi:hypothetical protein